MEPSFGPVAGGTNLTIIIGSDTIEYISRYVGSNIGDIRQVYFGEHLSSTLVSLKSSSRLEDYSILVWLETLTLTKR